MRYLSVCSGIEAATVAWHPMGWTPVAFSDVDPFASAVLAHHYPNIPNYGDMTQHETWPLKENDIDLLVGGTPCQSFSMAGLRGGLHDPRGGLMLTYLEIAKRLKPKWIVWENVPGVLSADGGRAFGTFLGALGELGYGWAYRVLDAQWVRTRGHPTAVAQRRRRVFVVGCLGDPAAAAKVLFERQSLQRDSKARRKKGKGTSPDIESCFGADGKEQQSFARLVSFGEYIEDDASSTVQSRDYKYATDLVISKPEFYRWQNNKDGLQADDVSGTLRSSSGTSGFHEMNHPVVVDNVSGTLGCRLSKCRTAVDGYGAYVIENAVTYDLLQVTCPYNAQNREPGLACHTLARDNAEHVGIVDAGKPTMVRRLTPKECERLQGFPDDHTKIAWKGKAPDDCPDGPRYKAIGNSMAVNCMEWIGERISAVNEDR